MTFSTNPTTIVPTNASSDFNVIDIEKDPVPSIDENKIADCRTDDGTNSIASNKDDVKTTTGRKKNIVVIVMVSTIIALLVSTIFFYKKYRTLTMKNEVMIGYVGAGHNYLNNITSDAVGCNDHSNKTMIETYSNGTDTNEDDGDRSLQQCPYMRNPVVARGSTVYRAATICWDNLYFYYCDYRCAVSYNDPVYDRVRRQYYVQCYCGTFGKYDIY